MTVEEARKALRASIRGQYVDVDQQILEALQKQIPLHAAIYEHENKVVMLCPICQTHLKTQEFCPSCGQRITYKETYT